MNEWMKNTIKNYLEEKNNKREIEIERRTGIMHIVKKKEKKSENTNKNRSIERCVYMNSTMNYVNETDMW